MDVDAGDGNVKVDVAPNAAPQERDHGVGGAVPQTRLILGPAKDLRNLPATDDVPEL